MFDLWAVNFFVYSSCKQCCGSGMFIPDPTFFHPGSRILIKEFKYFNPKKKQKIWSWLFIPDPGSGCWLSPIPDPESRGQKAPNPGSRIRIRNTAYKIYFHLNVFLWMRSSQVVWAFDCQCRSRNSLGLNPSILRHSGNWGAADNPTCIF